MAVGFFYASNLVIRSLIQFVRIGFIRAGKEAKEKQRPDADVNHDISGIEYVVPIGDMLDVDEVDHAAIHESIQYIAGAATDYEAEADILIALDRCAKPEIGAYAYQKRDANCGEYPTHPL